jgi:hypothetical protein
MGIEIIDRPNKPTKADVVTGHVNTIIQEMIDNAGVDEIYPGKRKKNAYLSVLGYNDIVTPLLSETEVPVDIPTLAKKPKGQVQAKREIRDRNGNLLRTFTENKRFWVEPGFGVNRETNMTLAFEHAMNVVDDWLKQSPELISPDMGWQRPRSECFPPVVINVTDGYYNIGGNPRRMAEALASKRTNNGNVLVFNCHFTTENKKPCVFPKEERDVYGIDPFYQRAEEIFYMSSIIPEPLRERASKILRKPNESGARCVVYNADLDTLIRFLRWCTVAMIPSTSPRVMW